MYLRKILYPVFALAVTAIGHEERRNTNAASVTIQPIGGLAPARTVDIPDPTSFGDPDFDPSVGTDENGPPDTEDADWVNAFLFGEPIDPLLDFYTHDLIKDDDGESSDSNSDAGDSDNTVQARTIPATSTVEPISIPDLVKERASFAFAMSHYRARQRIAGLNSSDNLPQPEDWQWSQSFMNGDDVDDDLIWDPADLDEPADDSTDDALLVSAADFQDPRVAAAIMTLSTNSTPTNSTPTNQSLAERVTHKNHPHKLPPPKNAVQVFRRYQRAMRNARHRKRVQKHKEALKRRHAAVERHKAAVARRKKAARAKKMAATVRRDRHPHIPGFNFHFPSVAPSPTPRHPAADYKKNDKLKHGVKKCGHPVPYGYLCDGSLNCHWWCVRGNDNCGLAYTC